MCGFRGLEFRVGRFGASRFRGYLGGGVGCRFRGHPCLFIVPSHMEETGTFKDAWSRKKPSSLTVNGTTLNPKL